MSDVKNAIEEVSEDDSSEDESDGNERVVVNPQFFMDDVHAQAVNELREANVDVENVLSQRLHQSVEQCVYELRQQMKYDSGQQ